LRKGLYETADALSPWSSKESRRILVFVPPMRKEAEEFTGRSKEIIEIKSRDEATVRSHVFFHLGPGISPHVPAPNTSVVGRDSPPQTAATISSKRYSLDPMEAMLASELRSVLTEMLVDKRVTRNR
jgi:hypothetical protein